MQRIVREMVKLGKSVGAQSIGIMNDFRQLAFELDTTDIQWQDLERLWQEEEFQSTWESYRGEKSVVSYPNDFSIFYFF